MNFPPAVKTCAGLPALCAGARRLRRFSRTEMHDFGKQNQVPIVTIASHARLFPKEQNSPHSRATLGMPA
jgi:hypothetical protein